ncbi:MAG: 1-deoxy-D-xylulose-5-phosphate synthase [Candidatus Wallbacteria bacterium]|nr:1-deoxy-D-xylulose-5-phosphate synthase [Candidatus Wallbacteria bacterium]
MTSPLDFLENLVHPQEVKKLSVPQLEELAEVIREKLVEVASSNGGHLAPNLGVVELTLALLARLDLPTDEIIWDVGHQAYVYKMLTGRYKRFPSIRTHGGLSGFPRRDESPFDTFGTAHASTSIAAGMGKAIARDMKGYRNNIVAVIGDGAMTGGLAHEGLNNAGHMKSKLLVILNDNSMSIAPNVGAYHHYLERIRFDPAYTASKKYIKEKLHQMPAVGGMLEGVLESMKTGLKAIVVPGLIFEELGFRYLGPVDGHSIEALLEELDLALSVEDQPVLLHVKTVKGKGYAPAEADKPKFHGCGAFDKTTGTVKPSSGPPAYQAVFGRTMVELGRQDPKIVGITAAMPSGTGLDAMARELPDQYFDVGIAEQYAVCFAAGMATSGMKPVCAIYSTFLQRGYDQIIHDVAIQNLPVVFAMDRGGIVGDDGPTHQGLYDIAYMRAVPNVVVMSPKDENELRHMLYTAVNHAGPIALRYPRGAGLGVELDSELKLLPIGKGEEVRAGTDVALLGYGHMLAPALEAATLLTESGVNAAVVNPRFAKPLDRELILSYARRGMPMVTVEEHSLMGGFGSAVCELLADEAISGVPLLRIGVPDELVEHGTQKQMREHYGLTPAGIAKRTREWLAKVTGKKLDEPARKETKVLTGHRERVPEKLEAASRA